MQAARGFLRRFASSAAVAARGVTAPPASPVRDASRLTIFDTTLRDGEQSPGCTLQLSEKLAIAHALLRLGVDVCEAGFPVASPGDFDAVRAIALEVGGELGPGRAAGQTMVIAALARATEKDIDRAYEAIKAAPRHRVHTFLATSDIHLEHKLRISRGEAIERAVRAVRHARSMCADVEFSTEDGGRSDRAFLVDVIGAVIEAGASTINVPDTVGYTMPGEYGELFAHLIRATPGAERVTWSTHCHNDLGLATANTLAAVTAGARQVEVTINGLGERAGNTALEEVVMTLAVRPHLFPARASGIDTSQITRTSRLVAHLTGMAVQANKAVVGANAFAHESGIHQDGMLKNASTYEIMTPASVGLSKTALVLGKHSGRAAYAARLRDLGHTRIAGAELAALVDKLKALADEKKIVTDADIEALAYAGLARVAAPTWSLEAAHVFTGTEAKPTATVTLRHVASGDERSAAAIGCGPVDAVYNAIRGIVGRPNDLVDFAIRSATDGTNALGEVTIKVSPAADGAGRRRVDHLRRVARALPADAGAAALAAAAEEERAAAAAARLAAADALLYNDPAENTGRAVYSGTATDKDILMAAAHAYVAALNRLLAADETRGAVVGAGAIGASV